MNKTNNPIRQRNIKKIEQYLKFHDFRICDFLADQLSNSITSLHNEVFIGMIEKYNAYISPIIFVYHTGLKKKNYCCKNHFH